MSTRINGRPGAIEQRSRLSWDTRTGATSTRTWIGPVASLLPIARQLQNNGWNYELAPDGGQNYILVATIGATWSYSGLLDNPVDVWESVSQKAEKDILSTDTGIIKTLSAADIYNIRSALANPPVAPDANTPAPDPVGMAAGSNALLVYKLMSAGLESKAIFVPTLRHTQTVSSLYAIATSQAGVGLIFLSATMATFLPPGITISLPADGGYTNPAGIVLNYGWMKDAPNVTVSAFNKSQITQEWTFGLWPQLIFGVPV